MCIRDRREREGERERERERENDRDRYRERETDREKDEQKVTKRASETEIYVEREGVVLLSKYPINKTGGAARSAALLKCLL